MVFPSILIFGYSPVEFEGLFWQKAVAKPSRQSYNADGIKQETLPAQRRWKTGGQRREAFLTTEPATDAAGTHGEQPVKEAYR